MTDFLKDKTYIDWFLKNQKAKKKERSEDTQKPASSQNFSF